MTTQFFNVPNNTFSWIDSHCHLQAHEFLEQQASIILQAENQGVHRMIVPAVSIHDCQRVIDLANCFESVYFTLGIHPLYVMQASDHDLSLLRDLLLAYHQHPKFLGVGEIGLDGFVQGINFDRQIVFYAYQLKLANEFNVPVLLHVRKAQDQVLKYVRQYRVRGGIAHAFNGSFQQAQAFIDLNFKLGFGGAMTFTRALQIRRLATELPLESIVLETDAPDIAPEWLEKGVANTPDQIPRIAQVLAELRHINLTEIAVQTSNNVRSCFA